MRHPRGFRAALAGLLASLLMLVSVLQPAAAPLVLEVAPLALLGNGEATGTLVSAEPLQPFETHDQ